MPDERLPDERHRPDADASEVAAGERAGRDRLAARDEVEGLKAEVATLRATIERMKADHRRQIHDLEATVRSTQSSSEGRLRAKAGDVARRLRGR